MRNLVIERITEYLRLFPDLMWELDLTPDELESMSNVELLDLLEEIVTFDFDDDDEI